MSLISLVSPLTGDRPGCSGPPAHHLDTGHSYVKLKRSLAQRFCTDRAAYTAAKTAFIDDVVARALSEQSLRRDG
ncbi:GrpB family protein [Amycolatopsis sp. NPDC004079]|uniref:GrpB family protein n=1 Tax=Amycolatopsis sp. NPDC004079 TaxID=3154549 RepID=UPI0033B7C190